MNTHTLFSRASKIFWHCLAGISVAAVIACFFCAALTKPFFAHAYQVKRVLHGSASIGTGTEVGTVNLTASHPILGTDPLNMTNAAVFFSSYSATTDYDRRYMDVLTLIDDPETVQFSRRATSSNVINLVYSVVEFAEGAYVMSGMTTVPETSYVKNVTLPESVNLTKAFPIISWKPYTGGSGTDENNV
ncbi:MAG: hypothetical protein WC547_06100, partial [Candidatus Omnitrophota bacterium]